MLRLCHEDCFVFISYVFLFISHSVLSFVLNGANIIEGY
jgi:hypothetical protein